MKKFLMRTSILLLVMIGSLVSPMLSMGVTYSWEQEPAAVAPKFTTTSSDVPKSFYPLTNNASSSGQGFSDVAVGVISGPMVLMRTIMSNMCYTLGFALLVMGLFQYRNHRHNPQETPLGKVVVTIIVGIVLLLLPFTYQFLQQIDPMDYLQ